jgi:hypothetical protein
MLIVRIMPRMVFDVYASMLCQYVLVLSDGEFLLTGTLYNPEA